MSVFHFASSVGVLCTSGAFVYGQQLPFQGFYVLIGRCFVVPLERADQSTAVGESARLGGGFDSLLFQEQSDRVFEAAFGKIFSRCDFGVPLEFGHERGAPDVEPLCKTREVDMLGVVLLEVGQRVEYVGRCFCVIDRLGMSIKDLQKQVIDQQALPERVLFLLDPLNLTVDLFGFLLADGKRRSVFAKHGGELLPFGKAVGDKCIGKHKIDSVVERV